MEIVQDYEKRKGEDMKGAYILADYPDKKTFYKELNYLMGSNVDFIEVGIPFNDPCSGWTCHCKGIRYYS